MKWYTKRTFGNLCEVWKAYPCLPCALFLQAAAKITNVTWSCVVQPCPASVDIQILSELFFLYLYRMQINYCFLTFCFFLLLFIQSFISKWSIVDFADRVRRDLRMRESEWTSSLQMCVHVWTQSAKSTNANYTRAHQLVRWDTVVNGIPMQNSWQEYVAAIKATSCTMPQKFKNLKKS